ncbi:MAG: hypothetical protein PVF07_06375 [Thiogranum sp.]|jgi:hypothetical protein
MQLSFERGREIDRERRTLPAEHYRKILLLLSRSRSDNNLFVPIRSMQYLAVVDREEIVFVDGQGPRFIELAWCDFHPGERADLREPVSYTCVYYDEKGRAAMARLQGEFFKALEILENRQPRPDGASVTPLERE